MSFTLLTNPKYRVQSSLYTFIGFDDMRILNIQLYKLAVIALTLSVPYSAYALPTIEEDQTIAYDSNSSNNNLLEIYGTLNNNARLTNQDVIDIYGILNNNSTGRIINTTSGTISNYGNLHNSGNITNSGSYNDYGALFNSGTYTNNLDAYVIADGYIENTASGNMINNGEINNGGHLFKNLGSFTNNGTMYTNEFQNQGTVVNGINGVFNSEDTLNTGSIQNEGEFNSSYNFENTGNVTGAGHFISDGNFLKNNGQMSQTSFQIDSGTVSGSGTFNGEMVLGVNGNIGPDNTLTLNGNLTSSGDYYFGFYGGPLAREGKLVVNGETTFFEGVFNIYFSDSYSLYDGLNLTLMTSNQFTGLENLTYTINNLKSNWSYKINTTGTDISILISAVPEPKSYGMLIAGLVLVRLASRSRKFSLLA